MKEEENTQPWNGIVPRFVVPLGLPFEWRVDLFPSNLCGIASECPVGRVVVVLGHSQVPRPVKSDGIVEGRSVCVKTRAGME
jgi:hypothetical protein